MATYISPILDHVRSGVGYLAGGPVVDFARRSVLAVFQKIQVGQLVIQDGTTIICGSQNVVVGSPPATVTTLKVKNSAFWLRVALFADMGFAESYMLGEFECPDLTAFFRIFIFNREQLSNGTTWTASISNAISGFLSPLNSLANSSLHISAHYDLSNEMFAAFLSDDMTYSCPIWKLQGKGKKEEESLEEAQMRKLDRIADLARLKPTDRVLEIGTGWGSFAIRAVQRFGCRVTSLTLSHEQKELAEQRIRESGLADKIQVQLCDYRLHSPSNDGPYDKIISIEMLEAVGREYLETYFRCINKLLKKDGGIAVFQCITIPEARYEAYAKSQDFIRKYIFPGGHLPSITQLVNSITNGSKGGLIVDTISDVGPHYAKTLRLWNEKFMKNFDSIIKPALLAKTPSMTDFDLEVFRRKWEYYFTYCEAAFNTKTLGDHIIAISREGALEQLEGVPL